MPSQKTRTRLSASAGSRPSGTSAKWFSGRQRYPEHAPVIRRSAAFRPALNRLTPSPTLSTAPTMSQPGERVGLLFTSGHMPVRIITSVKTAAVADALTRTSPGLGSSNTGSSMTRCASGPSNSVIPTRSQPIPSSCPKNDHTRPPSIHTSFRQYPRRVHPHSPKGVISPTRSRCLVCGRASRASALQEVSRPLRLQGG